MGRFDGVDGHPDIFGKKLDGEGSIREDSAYLGGRKNHRIGFCFLKKLVDLIGLCQIKILPRSENQFDFGMLALQQSADRCAHHSLVARNEYSSEGKAHLPTILNRRCGLRRT